MRRFPAERRLRTMEREERHGNKGEKSTEGQKLGFSVLADALSRRRAARFASAGPLPPPSARPAAAAPAALPWPPPAAAPLPSPAAPCAPRRYRRCPPAPPRGRAAHCASALGSAGLRSLLRPAGGAAPAHAASSRVFRCSVFTRVSPWGRAGEQEDTHGEMQSGS